MMDTNFGGARLTRGARLTHDATHLEDEIWTPFLSAEDGHKGQQHSVRSNILRYSLSSTAVSALSWNDFTLKIILLLLLLNYYYYYYFYYYYYY